jgi:hypothetical protein
MDITELNKKVVAWTHLARNRDQWLYPVRTEIFISLFLYCTDISALKVIIHLVHALLLSALASFIKA